ncbi:MAG: hypothetical protein OSB69_17390 [Alphaproteobacteria bacterium]|nr:hypothetical protein [Alphaproteobacteria bacterium]
MAHNDRLRFPITLSTEFGGAFRDLYSNLGISLYVRALFPNRLPWVLADFEQTPLYYPIVNPDNEFLQVENIGGLKVVRYDRVLTMRPDCVACHTRP